MTHDGPGGSQPQAWVPQGGPDLYASPYAAPASGAPAAAATLPPYTPPAQSPYQAPHQGQPSYQGQAPSPSPYQAPYQGQSPYSAQPWRPGQGANSGQGAFPGQGAYPGQGPYPGPMPYGQAGFAQQPMPAPKPTLAIVGLVLAVILPPVGLVLSIVAVVRARRTGGAARGIAITGIVVSLVSSLLASSVALPVYLHQREVSGARDAYERTMGALVDNDCDGFMSATTPEFQAQMGVITCEDFAALIEYYASSPIPLGNVPVIGVEVDGDVATVTTMERAATADGGSTIEEVDYRVVREGDVWLLDGFVLND